MKTPGFKLQDEPRIFVAGIAGTWLLEHSTPSWRVDDPHKGFQRIVKTERAQQIATAVLEQRRTFPNAIVLATDDVTISETAGELTISDGVRFLVIDGQHRLWAQKFSEYEATYACILHTGLSEIDMARLFIEINDNQKRVQSSLRWDLVRLVRPDEREHEVMAAELVYELSTDTRSPLFQRIDRTGEQPQIPLKQGSIAPEIRSLVSKKTSPLRDMPFEGQRDVLFSYLAAIRSLDPDGWKQDSTPLSKARVLRALLQLLPEVANALDADIERATAADFYGVLNKIDVGELTSEKLRAVQGSAGIAAIRQQIEGQLFGGAAG
ncbi:MAG: DGQHR domain-containing protein [Actinomycetota bacterium]